ncbi:PREDICTED: uncharacterized protein LOC109127001 [Camelina sativa]|uniref:Uncharacterized protein LOC109127001 n=1 Tax=Camelina sativa TaxID=90675 RepID=A0ABM1QIK6_CAMSA|nr:PREDICTED: uncharacterized protein LOC109127001 [Camelina sativa]
MCKAKSEQAAVWLSILKAYGKATGQEINPAKSAITFGSKVPETVKLEIHGTLGIKNEGGVGKYLRLPECFSGSKVDMLSYIKDRLNSKVLSWHSKTLSMGGKEVMIKSVALAMLVFAMLCFKLSKSTCEADQKIHWISCKKFCVPKELGGMGFRDIGLFNQALLAKQAWQLLQYSQSLFAKVLKSRYYPNLTFMDAGLGKRPPFGWRSIMFGRELMKKRSTNQSGEWVFAKGLDGSMGE